MVTKAEEGEELEQDRLGRQRSGTSAVPEVVVGGRVVLAQPLQDQLVVQQAVERPQEEDVEGKVANPLLLKVSTQSLHLPAGSVMNECNVFSSSQPCLLHQLC